MQDANVASASTGSREQSVTAVSQRMGERTLEALKGSIEKWKAIEAGTGGDEGWRNCPLCRLFNNPSTDDSCQGCPVTAFTWRLGCGGTPYETWVEACKASDVYPRQATTPELVALARAEREFLESLLPAAQT